MRSHLWVIALGALSLSAATALPRGAAPVSALVAAPAPTTVTAVAVAPPAERDSRAMMVDAALSALSSQVTEKSHPDALQLAFRAYYNFSASHPDQVKNPYFYFVDYGLDSRTPRGYVFDMKSLKVVDGPFTVAHGRGSSNGHYGVPMHFSNGSGSYASSLGLFVTGQTYGFTGHSGGSTYSSIGLRLNGVSGRFNSDAFARGVVVHGAPYVTPSGSGRSEGCPAMEPSRARRLIPMIADGALVFLFSPNDATWMHADPWAAGVSPADVVTAN
jgi:hypothetical protein